MEIPWRGVDFPLPHPYNEGGEGDEGERDESLTYFSLASVVYNYRPNVISQFTRAQGEDSNGKDHGMDWELGSGGCFVRLRWRDPFSCLPCFPGLVSVRRPEAWSFRCGRRLVLCSRVVLVRPFLFFGR